MLYYAQHLGSDSVYLMQGSQCWIIRDSLKVIAIIDISINPHYVLFFK